MKRETSVKCQINVKGRKPAQEVYDSDRCEKQGDRESGNLPSIDV